ncbi:MAG: DNA alkylation repair protein [Holosporaceae bacterium]|jgi:3-methyladenine DNA glycosylase AlkD|nr:DNA alkylation repair protein [Holosporaceae bacterium]
MLDSVIAEIKSASSEDYALFQRKMLQSVDGYGKGDLLLGCRVPHLRKIAQRHRLVSEADLLRLLRSDYHEVRVLALLIMVWKFHAIQNSREELVKMYLENVFFINNWDLVDLSCHHIIGSYFDPEDEIFERFSNSNNLWENRISIVSTQTFIKKDYFDLTLRLSKKFLKHQHHLIHKACGWMLREVGKRNEGVLKKFLREHRENMPRIMFSYAKERLLDLKL